MTTDRQSVNEMAKFMAAMDDTGPAQAQSGVSEQATNDSVRQMKTILERFHMATDQLISEAPSDRPLREALATEATPQGVRIGDWEIVVHEAGKRKLYDVVHAVTAQSLATDLMLFEAAYGLVNHLNNGGRINSAAVLNLLAAEQQYAGAIHDMVLFRHRLTQTNGGAKSLVHEARYTAAQRVAVTARTQVRKLAESLGSI